MAEATASARPLDLERLLVEAAERSPSTWLGEVEVAGGRAPSPFAQRFSDRHARLPPTPEAVAAWAREKGRGAGPVFLRAPAPFLLGEAFPVLVREVAAPRANVKLLAAPPGVGGAAEPARSDLATMRGVPSMTVLAPADAASLRAAVEALTVREGTAYVRLPPPEAPTVTSGGLTIGRAEELRSGADLTIVSYGSALAPAVALADDLARVGVGVRLLDVASLKPIDEAAIVRAARETGALLVIEAAPAATGIGTYVAAIASENAPVPVRRIGWSDVAEPGASSGTPDGPELSPERLRDEAWELLRWRGKVQ